MNCAACNSGSGIYELKACMGCAVRLVISARPSKARQLSMLAYLSTYYGYDQNELIERVKKTRQMPGKERVQKIKTD